MDPAPLRSFPSVLGEFRIDAILGEGGSGIVYDAAWGPRRVALKVLHPTLADTDRVRAQFLSEAQRLQGIAHPSVVKVLAVGELPDGRPYLAMERLEGETLASVLARGPLSLADALPLFSELCGAVHTLHAQGLIHRDLKPENVFIVNGVHAVLLDFGIAKELAAAASTTTVEGGVRGTPAYMAPERFFGQPASIATDLYELAVTFYAMLSGRLPWDDLADPEARLSPRPLVELAPVPDELDVEVRRALSTRAANRPATANALLDAIKTVAGAEVSPKPAETARMRPASLGDTRKLTTDESKTPLAWAPSERTAKPEAATPRSRWPYVAGIAVVAAAIAGGVIWRLRDREETTAPVAAVTPPVTLTNPIADDPWGAAPPKRAPAPEIPTTGPEVSVDDARTEAAKAMRHLPADTSMVIGVLVGPLRRDPRFTPIFDRLAAHPKMAALSTMLPPCVKALGAASEWFVFGSVGFGAQEQGTLILRGRWTREDVERCFAETSKPRTMTDGATLLELPEVGWIDFLDPSTVYISVRQDLAAAQVHANVTRATGLTKRTRALLDALPGDRVLTFVVDGTGDLAWPSDVLPKGSDASAWLRPDADTVSFVVTLDPHSEAEATTLKARLDDEVGKVFEGASPKLGTLTVTRAKTRVAITGALSSLMMGIVTSAI